MMDDHLRLESLSAATLRMLLVQERAHRQELEQEVLRLRAALARQNAVIIRLEQRDAERERELQALRTLVAGLTEQNTLLRQQVAILQQENARLRGVPLAPPPDPAPEIKPASARREQKTRKKRAPEHKRVLPEPVGLEAGRIGRCRFGPRLIAAIATMATVERLPGRMIQDRLKREYGLTISHGGIVGLLKRMATRGQPAYEQLNQDVRASPVVHGDETGWREAGQHTTVWTVSTPQVVYVHHGRRTNEEIDGILGADFGGTIVADCYAGYDHFLGPKQRCWAHLLRDLDQLLHQHGQDTETVAWVEGIRWIYEQARIPRPAAEEGSTPQAVRAREHRARQCEALVLLLCPAQPDPALPYATLANRLRKHLTELFTFVRDPLVPPTNNAAERSLRPLVIARKVSGGTRSEDGSTTRMTLYSLCATAKLQGQDPTVVYQQLLLAPPGAPSPLTAPASTF